MQVKPRSMIPDQITLPDGRQFLTHELLNQVTNYRVINRLNRQPRKPKILAWQKTQGSGKRIRTPKYTQEERIWQSQATISDIARRYSIDLVQAQRMKYHAGYLLNSQE
jgi:hypothetical protein